jgi:enoyl-CoA hydratase/carnithine racemase
MCKPNRIEQHRTAMGSGVHLDHRRHELSEHIITELTDGILRIEIRRPEKKNAFSMEMYRAMADVIERSDRESTIRVVLLHGQPGVFSAGNEMESFSAMTADSPIVRFMHRLSEARKPVIAAVDGVAIGIGTTLLFHCDLVYASRRARFHLPFVKLGLCPEFGSSVILPRLAGHQRAAELLYFGEPFGAEVARELGLANAVVDEEALLSHATERAQVLAAQPPASLQLTKRMLKQAPPQSIRQIIDDEIKSFVACIGTAEAQEAFGAFREKRRPDFSRFS